jgi:hypothetical protein
MSLLSVTGHDDLKQQRQINPPYGTFEQTIPGRPYPSFVVLPCLLYRCIISSLTLFGM